MEIIAISFMIVLMAVIIVFGALLIALAHLVVDNKDKDNNRNN
jgi:heme/copper-type cytochrome/quinol oxidase subunit 2